MPVELLPHRFQNLMRGPGAEVGGEQRVLEFRKQLGIDFLFARNEVFDFGGDLRPGLRDRLFQPVEQRTALFALVLFFLAEDGQHNWNRGPAQRNIHSSRRKRSRLSEEVVHSGAGDSTSVLARFAGQRGRPGLLKGFPSEDAGPSARRRQTSTRVTLRRSTPARTARSRASTTAASNMVSVRERIRFRANSRSIAVW